MKQTYEFRAKPLFAEMVRAGACSPPGAPVYAMIGWLYHEGGKDVMPVTHTHMRFFNYARR